MKKTAFFAYSSVIPLKFCSVNNWRSNSACMISKTVNMSRKTTHARPFPKLARCQLTFTSPLDTNRMVADPAGGIDCQL